MEKLLFKNKQTDKVLRSDKDHVCLLLNEKKESDGYMYDIETIECHTDDYLEEVKKYMAECISSYDESSAVNEFFVNGKSAWIKLDKRLGVRTNVSDAIKNGDKSIDLWLGSFKISVAPDVADSMLRALESKYASPCYNVTAMHKAAVEGMTSVEDVLGYDYTKGYPDKLNFDI